MRGLTDAETFAALDRRLDPASHAPLAVAYSGGSDSLALLLAACEWAQAHGRRVLALTVDHGLNPLSAEWTRHCAGVAAGLGAGFQALRWEGDKPATGLPAAARAARHALLAEAARAAGARVLLMGHTADDRLEAALMRREGSTVPTPREWAPSPAWPQGRGLFILRPLLTQRRSDLRGLLAAGEWDWIDDIANFNPVFARARARHALSRDARPPPLAAEPRFDIAFEAGEDGVIRLPRTAPAAVLAAACLCAAGTVRPPRGVRLQRLAERLAAPGPVTATLCGARIEADDEDVRICRDAGETARGGMPPLALVPGNVAIWDGRYEIGADAPGLTVRPMKGLAAGLSSLERPCLLRVPAAARGALPVVVNPSGTMICPIFAEAPGVRLRALSGERFRAAIGLVDRESRA